MGIWYLRTKMSLTSAQVFELQELFRYNLRHARGHSYPDRFEHYQLYYRYKQVSAPNSQAATATVVTTLIYCLPPVCCISCSVIIGCSYLSKSSALEVLPNCIIIRLLVLHLLCRRSTVPAEVDNSHL